VTIISPATLSLGTPLAQITPTVMPTLPAAATGTTAPPTAQPQFITPGVVQPLVTIVFPTATAFGGTPSATPSGLITPTAFDVVSDECIYVVQPGDNLFRIAVNNDASLEEMRNANPELVGEAPILQPGQELRIPNCESQSVSSPTATPVPGVTSAPPANPASTTYVVRPGDTLFSIAQQFGTTIDAIVAANSLANPNALDVGQQLIIPQSGG
jgi:LysM repeat protein